MTDPSSPSLNDRLTDQRFHRVPPRAATIGITLFLVSLGVLFAASMLAYLLIRLNPRTSPDLGTVHLPNGLWVSTAIILISSYTMHRALANVQRERQDKFRQALVLTLLLSLAFVLVQTPSLVSLGQDMSGKLDAWNQARETAMVEGTPPQGDAPIEGLVLALIVIHALHVLGGVIPLFITTLNAHQHKYDHEQHTPVRFLTYYWHFLDGVWIVMFAVLLLTR